MYKIGATSSPELAQMQSKPRERDSTDLTRQSNEAMQLTTV